MKPTSVRHIAVSQQPQAKMLLLDRWHKAETRMECPPDNIVVCCQMVIL